jgi:hypothetical protein
MHSGDKLDGSVCKCMECARARHVRVKVLARKYGFLDQPEIDPRVLKLHDLIVKEYQL